MLEKRNPPVGSRPGTLAIPAGSPAPRVSVFDFSGEHLTERFVEDLAELEPFAQTQATTWVDWQGMGDEAALWRVAKIFGIHPLALEDAVNIPQRSKTELYEAHQIIIARSPLAEGSRLGAPQVCFVLGQNYLVTFQDRYFGFFDPVRERIRAGIGPIREGGPDYLAYALIDALVDRYFPVVDGISQRLDDLEDAVLLEPDAEHLTRIHQIRRDIATLRRVGWPQRETVGELARAPSPFVSEETRVYFRDTFDHMSQIMGRVDFCREVTVGLMDIYLSTVGYRQNEIMKVLTLMASIFIPLTFVAGIYGMNFEYMPELQRPGAYFLVLTVMMVIAMLMIAYFRHRGWLGRSRRRRRGGGDPPGADL
ncbi:MAG TPA: magnesium/cobalt transporter CorA [Myxococcota bacterium]